MRGCTIRCLLLLAGLSVSALAPAAARAADDAGGSVEDRAAALKKAGDEAMEALRYADALAAYSDAHAVSPNPALLYNMGRALQALNRFPEALEKLEAFDAAASPELKQRVPRLPTLIAELRERVSTVTIHTNVDGARVLVRSTVVGKSPLAAPLRLESGKADVEVEAEGYFPSKQTVDLPGGGAVKLEATLHSRSMTGILAVRASTPGAEVLVDGRRAGLSPLEANVPSGPHTILVRRAEYVDYETSAVVPAGGTRLVTVELERSSILSRWWFWGGVGAVAVAGVVVTAAVLSERSADTGTIAPGQLSAPTGGVPIVQF